MFFASFTLPILPAPMVFPRAHWPVGVVMVVRRRGCVEAVGVPCAAVACFEESVRSAAGGPDMSTLSRGRPWDEGFL